MKFSPLLLALGLFAGSLPSFAQDTGVPETDITTTNFSDWTVKCGSSGASTRCVMGQTIQEKVSEEAAVSIALEIGYLPSETNPTMLITVPLGVPLIPGVQLQIDAGEAQRVPFQLCSQQGCLAAVPLDAALIGALKKGNQAKVAFAVGGDQGLALPVSLTGFTKAFNHFKSGQGK